MAFYGSSFSFDDVSCEEYGVMLYDFANTNQGSGTFASGLKVVEDRLPRRYTPLHYDSVQNEPLEFTMSFGPQFNTNNEPKAPDRADLDAIGKWLTGKKEYCWLSVEQDDMEVYRYKCIITDLKFATFGSEPWMITCTVRCDSPFAYQQRRTFSYTCNGTLSVNLFCDSAYAGFYKPAITISLTSGNSVRIVNNTDGGRAFEFTSIPSPSGMVINVDNENQIITNSKALNLYPSFNFNFFRLVRGDNNLSMTGNFAVQVICDFPANIGG